MKKSGKINGSFVGEKGRCSLKSCYFEAVEFVSIVIFGSTCLKQILSCWLADLMLCPSKSLIFPAGLASTESIRDGSSLFSTDPSEGHHWQRGWRF